MNSSSFPISTTELFKDHQILKQPVHDKGHLLAICAIINGLECMEADYQMHLTVSKSNPYLIPIFLWNSKFIRIPIHK